MEVTQHMFSFSWITNIEYEVQLKYKYKYYKYSCTQSAFSHCIKKTRQSLLYGTLCST